MRHDPNNPDCRYSTDPGVASPDSDFCTCPQPATTSWVASLPAEPRHLIEQIAPLAEKAEAGPLSFGDVNRLHALVLDFVLAVRAAT